MTTNAHKMGQYLMAQTIKRAQGRDKPYCVGSEPSDMYYVSNLSPEYAMADRDDFDAKTRPSSISLECKPTASTATVTIAFDFYVPSFPTYEEYEHIQERRLRAAKIETADRLDDVETWTEVDDDQVNRDSLYALDEPFYRRGTVELDYNLSIGIIEREAAAITKEIRAALQAEVEALADDHILTTTEIDPDAFFDVDLTALTAEEFESVRDTVTRLEPETLDWDLRVGTEVEDGELTITLANHPPNPQVEDPNDGLGERYIFNPQITLSASLEPYTFDLIPEDYRYDQTMWAKGRNCSTTVDRSTTPPTVSTTAIPTSPVYEFEFNTNHVTGFEELSRGDTVQTLQKIGEGMRAYRDDWTGSRRGEIAEELELNDAELAEYDAAAAEFETEIERFEHGVEILRQDPDAHRAFQLMNEVNARQHDSFNSWRLFQLVYIVSNLSGIVRREHPDLGTEFDEQADVLWFPTGGGKTEAYLGLILFNLFYDRLRGKDRGVTAWIRFPLRLLSRQQKSRFLESLLYAEELRRSDSERGLNDRGDPFSLGFFAGSYDTPNAVGTSRDTYREMFQDSQEELEDNCRVIDTCPLCESAVDVEYDVGENTVYHRCTGDDCLGRLPLYVVDRDIYRYVPSILLGSLDKIAIMGLQPRFANLLGNYTTRCPDHGYGYSGKCSEHQLCERDEDELERVSQEDVYDPVPTLHLVDEVHLLNEELGTFAAHYETLYQTLCEEIHGKQPKILTSTATISEYERQIEHLFQKEATRFPADGPVQGETFYGRLTETEEREYLGFTPANRSHLYAVLDTIIDYHQIIRDEYNTPAEELGEAAGIEDLTEEKKSELLDLYETSVIYFNNKIRKDRYRENITKYANREMQMDGYETGIRERQLTADTEDPELLRKLEDPDAEDLSFEDRIDTVPATSFIGHGIDVDRFNMMLFFGFPRRTFQYIQASSRVGRQSGVVGFVLNVFDPLKERDKHRFRYFEKLHAYLDRTVEPVPIDRWAKFGIERTFTGVFQSILIQYYRPLMYRKYELAPDDDDDLEPANVQKATHLYELMSNNDYPELNKDNIQALVERAFGLHNDFYTNPYFHTQVEHKTNQVWQYWRSELPTMSYPRFPDGKEPMISLRDIGDQGSITPQYKSQDFVDLLTSRGD